MIAKVQYSRLSRRIFVRANLSAYVSSVSRANYAQIIPPNDHESPSSSEFEAKIQSLKNNLHANTLIHVLSSTNDLDSSLRLFKWASLQNRFRHTADTYYHIIMKLGMACRVDEMEGFCNEMVKGGFVATEQALLGLLDSFVRHHRLDEALRVLFVINSCGYNPSIALVNRMLGALVEEKKGFQSVLFVYKEMVKASILPTIETLNYLLQALFDADRVVSVLDQYKRMQKKGCCPNSRTYEILVSGLIGKNLLDEALVVVNEILDSGSELELNFFSHILPLLFRMNKQEVGLRLFEKIKASEVVLDSSIYEVLIQYFSMSLCMDDATNLLNDMINADLKPSDCVFVDLVNGFCKLNKLSEAKQLLEDRQVMEANPYNALLEGYCKARNFVEVMWLFQELVQKNVTNSRSWSIFIRYLSENGRSDIVYRVLGRMIVSGSMPDSVTYSAVIVEKCKSHEVHDAIKMFHRVCEKHWVVDSSCYATLIESLCQLGKIQEAAEVFRYMSINKCTLRASSFSMLLRGLCLIGKVDTATELLPLAYYSGLSCSSADYSTIMKGLSKLSEGNASLVIVARMVVEGCPLDVEAYNELVNSMSEHHRAIECALFLNQMVSEGLFPDSEILADALTCLAQHLRLHMVLPAIDKLVSEHEVADPAIYNTLINGLWKEGRTREACRLLDLMLEKGWIPDPQTHHLLINSGGSEASVNENGSMQDEIMNILSDGFGEL